MSLNCVSVACETLRGVGPGGDFYLGDTLDLLDCLIDGYSGKVKCIYLDPPFLTGQSFDMSVRVGVKDWKNMQGSVRIRAFEDKFKADDYFAMLRRVLAGAREMLREDGALFLHVDYRAQARLRLICDDIFGEDNFVNEIIWAYKSGGRARNSFSRKHDVILFYRKSSELDFNIEAVLEKRETPPDNHMRRHIDSDGRAYRTIRSGDKIYTYYDDEPVAPTDVWDDISHLQQRDYERTGYDTQKPLRLLRRVERCVTRKGEIVMDLFAGSCTSLEAARLDGMAFLGADKCPLSVNIARRRLGDSPVVYHLPPSPEAGASCDACISNGAGVYVVTLKNYSPDEPLYGVSGMDAVDNWAVGYIENGDFVISAHFERSQKRPEIELGLTMPVYDGVPALRIGDISGVSRYFLLK